VDAAGADFEASGVFPYAPMLTRPPLGIGSRANGADGSRAPVQGLWTLSGAGRMGGKMLMLPFLPVWSGQPT
jgi:hypothetical protein